jgi:hypothetical protein
LDFRATPAPSKQWAVRRRKKGGTNFLWVFSPAPKNSFRGAGDAIIHPLKKGPIFGADDGTTRLWRKHFHPSLKMLFQGRVSY